MTADRATPVATPIPILDLCKNGVTIIDSPGLNEHPDRNAITEQILTNIDAVIFLTDAQRPLTKSKKDLLEDLQQRLNITSSLNGVDNLFIVVNKIFDRAISKCDEELNEVEKDIEKSQEEHVAWITDRKQLLDDVRGELSSYISN